MSKFTDWLRDLPDRWTKRRERKREREASAAYARRGGDPNPGLDRRHGSGTEAGGGGA